MDDFERRVQVEVERRILRYKDELQMYGQLLAVWMPDKDGSRHESYVVAAARARFAVEVFHRLRAGSPVHPHLIRGSECTRCSYENPTDFGWDCYTTDWESIFCPQDKEP